MGKEITKKYVKYGEQYSKDWMAHNNHGPGAKYRSAPRAYTAKGPPTDQPLQVVVSSGQQEGI